jgi:hypothetical protein
VQFAQIMRDQLPGSGIRPSTYVDSGGLNPRANIAGLNLAQFPSVLGARQHEEPVRFGAGEDAGASLEVRRCGSWRYRGLPLRAARSSNPRCSMSSFLPALDLLLEVLQHLAVVFRKPNGANVCSKNAPMAPAPCHDVLTVTDESGPG